MIRLVGVELTRLRRRRAVVVLLLLALVAPLIVAAGVAWETRPVSAEEAARARELVQRELSSPQFDQTIKECAAAPRDWGIRAEPDTDDARARCLEQNRPRVEWFVGRPPLRLGDQLVTATLVLALVTALLMLAATTFIGHDWSSGSMSNQLLFEPRRQRVFWAKALAVVLLALLASAMALALLWGGLGLTAQLRDIGLREGLVRAILEQGLRGVVFAAAAALGAFAVTNLFRSTVFTVGAMFAVAVGASIVITLLPFPDHERFQLPVNLTAWVTGSADYYREVSQACFSDRTPPPGMDCQEYGVVTLWESARYFGSMLVLALGLSAWSFQRRDVP